MCGERGDNSGMTPDATHVLPTSPTWGSHVLLHVVVRGGIANRDFYVKRKVQLPGEVKIGI